MRCVGIGLCCRDWRVCEGWAKMHNYPPHTQRAAPRLVPRYSLIAVAGLVVLSGCAAQQVAVSPAGEAPVCAVKAGERQSYWNERAAWLDGALVVLTGECPARPNSEGGAGGSGGM
jgi:hypothetical protein